MLVFISPVHLSREINTDITHICDTHRALTFLTLLNAAAGNCANDEADSILYVFAITAVC